LGYVRSLEKQTGRSQAHSIDEKEVENFCKGAAHISLVQGRPFKIVTPDEPVRFGDRSKYLLGELRNPESLVGLYLAFLAWDEFAATHRTTPAQAGGEGIRVAGSNSDDLETDTQKLTGIACTYVDSIIDEVGSRVEDPGYTEIKDRVGQYCQELSRAGGAELHNIASLSGGLIAQEVIKVITKQYVPIDNICVFDGITSRTSVLRI
jgi:amyloid beta precursor protein binding protein 1